MPVVDPTPTSNIHLDHRQPTVPVNTLVSSSTDLFSQVPPHPLDIINSGGQGNFTISDNIPTISTPMNTALSIEDLTKTVTFIVRQQFLSTESSVIAAVIETVKTIMPQQSNGKRF